jgi:hypothetical protein
MHEVLGSIPGIVRKRKNVRKIAGKSDNKFTTMVTCLDSLRKEDFITWTCLDTGWVKAGLFPQGWAGWGTKEPVCRREGVDTRQAKSRKFGSHVG